jgi:hypothetical protein
MRLLLFGIAFVDHSNDPGFPIRQLLQQWKTLLPLHIYDVNHLPKSVSLCPTQIIVLGLGVHNDTKWVIQIFLGELFRSPAFQGGISP